MNITGSINTFALAAIIIFLSNDITTVLLKEMEYDHQQPIIHLQVNPRMMIPQQEPKEEKKEEPLHVPIFPMPPLPDIPNITEQNLQKSSITS